MQRATRAAVQDTLCLGVAQALLLISDTDTCTPFVPTRCGEHQQSAGPGRADAPVLRGTGSAGKRVHDSRMLARRRASNDDHDFGEAYGGAFKASLDA